MKTQTLLGRSSPFKGGLDKASGRIHCDEAVRGESLGSPEEAPHPPG